MGEDGPAAGVREEILAFISRPVYPSLVTTTRAGTPYLRPVICVNDGFVVRMITRLESKKVQHIRRSPMVAVFWSGLEGSPPQSVMLQARVTLDPSVEAIDRFAQDYRRKNPARTRPMPGADGEIARVVLVAEPTLVRADGFRGFRPVILREADLHTTDVRS